MPGQQLIVTKEIHCMATTRHGATARTPKRLRPKARSAKQTSRVRARQTKRASPAGKRWSAAVMKRSDALDLERGVFTKRSPRQIALSLKHSAQTSRRRKGEPFQSAMSMLTFHINRGGKGLSAERKRVLNQAKVELRGLFGR